MEAIKTIQCLILMLMSVASCIGQNLSDIFKTEEGVIEKSFRLFPNGTLIDTVYIDYAPNTITRTIIQNKVGHMYFATFNGLIKYDGQSFSNVSEDVTQSRFFSVFEDSKANLWSGTIGDGVFCDNGHSIQHFTTNDGLLNNEIVCIYEDAAGHIWLGANGGASMYDGKQFRNYILSDETMTKDKTGVIVPNLQRPPLEVNAIMEDKNGNLWFGTRGNTFIYNGHSFRSLKDRKAHFTNVRSIIKDKNENIWLGGNDGLWRYDYKSFSQYSDHFVGYIYEDSKGNIWTSAIGSTNWSVNRYDRTDAQTINKTPIEIKSNEGMFFGIVEDSHKNIWMGTLQGVYRYDGQMFTYFMSE